LIYGNENHFSSLKNSFLNKWNSIKNQSDIYSNKPYYKETNHNFYSDLENKFENHDEFCVALLSESIKQPITIYHSDKKITKIIFDNQRPSIELFYSVHRNKKCYFPIFQKKIGLETNEFFLFQKKSNELIQQNETENTNTENISQNSQHETVPSQIMMSQSSQCLGSYENNTILSSTFNFFASIYDLSSLINKEENSFLKNLNNFLSNNNLSNDIFTSYCQQFKEKIEDIKSVHQVLLNVINLIGQQKFFGLLKISSIHSLPCPTKATDLSFLLDSIKSNEEYLVIYINVFTEFALRINGQYSVLSFIQYEKKVEEGIPKCKIFIIYLF
jgi:hypothetical protein